MTTELHVRPAAPDASPPRQRWGLAQFLAAASLPLLAYEIWTLTGWLFDGPHQIVQGRDSGGPSWWMARVIEIGATALAMAVLAIVVRDSLKAGQMTFDLKLWIALVLTSFWDTVVNFLQPIWFYSSNFVNLNEWWGHAPGIVSPAAGIGPYPIVALTMLYPCFVLESRLASAGWSAVRRRRPDISNPALLGFGLLAALAIGACISMLFVLPHLWAGPGMGPMLLSTDTYRWSLAEFLYVGVWSTTICALRFFVDQDGNRLTERGLGQLSTTARNVVSTLATTAWCSLAVIGWSLLVMLTGFHARTYPADYPAHLPSVVCDIPGNPATTGSVYGPCPGSPGFTMPLRTSAAG
ncbi:MAG: hypothetical protein JWR83_366 [Aeromicrobium sp.]|nr:hypothetical protein [Aeromicrobium sp.]